MKVVKHVFGWSIVAYVAMILIPVGTHTITKTVFGKELSWDFNVSLWTAMTKGGGFEMLFWIIVGSLALAAFFNWAGAKIKMIPTLMTAGWMISGLVAIVATLLIDGVPSEKLKGIDTIIEPAMWTALTFFVIRELMWVVEIIRNKMETA